MSSKIMFGIKELMGLAKDGTEPVVDVGSAETETVEFEKTQAELDRDARANDPFEKMIVEFREFAHEHELCKPLKLTFEEQRPGCVLVYQGQKDIVWVWLRNTGCSFIRKSLLLSIKNLGKKDPDSLLYQYFKNYSMVTGEHDASV